MEKCILMTLIWLMVGFSAVIGCWSSDTSALHIEPLMHSAVLDDHGKFVMSWTPGPDHVTIEIQVETKGYVGLGFSPSGGMKGADIVLGWVGDHGEIHLTDRYATGNSSPVIDAHQDVTLLRGHRNASHTTLRFRRPWLTCDQLQDIAITADTQRVIYAYGDSPVDPSMSLLPYHSNRGSKSLLVKEPRFNAPAPSNDVQYWDVRAPNISVPSHHSTLYWCTLFKVPEMNQKSHYIAHEPLLSEASRALVHHMILYECHLPNSSQHLEHLLGLKGAQCYSHNTPLAWLFCNSPLATWAVGSEGGALPGHVGIPLGEEWGGSTYFMLEVHYDNRHNVKGVVDNSGLRVFHTKRLRQHDGGILDIGHGVSPMMVVGPHSRDWVTVGHCSGSCTQRAFPPGGIRIIGGLLHSHLLGRSLKVQHIRSGKELSPIVQDEHYDFNYQQERVLPNERTLLPKDHLILNCHYDSTDRSTPTYGGFSTQDEMCLAFLLYYPRIPLIKCNSVVDQRAFFKELGIEEIYGQKEMSSMMEDAVKNEIEKLERLAAQHNHFNATTDISLSSRLNNIIIRKPFVLQNQSLFGLLQERSLWMHGDVVARLQNLARIGPYESICQMHKDAWNSKGTVEQFPVYEPYKSKERSCTDGSTNTSTKKSFY